MSILNVNSANGAGMAFSVLRGSSAYEVAVKNGFEGTEQEWLESLKGGDPLLLDFAKVEEYKTNSGWGDRALAAIQQGQQILVKVPNADGGIYTAIYSPVLMYQVPNYENNYLYLFFLKDEKQDLSDLMGLPEGSVNMPQYGELKMLLSKTYNENPLGQPHYNNSPVVNASKNKPVVFGTESIEGSESTVRTLIYYNNPGVYPTVDEVMDAYIEGKAYVYMDGEFPLSIVKKFTISYGGPHGEINVKISEYDPWLRIKDSTQADFDAAMAKYLP